MVIAAKTSLFLDIIKDAVTMSAIIMASKLPLSKSSCELGDKSRKQVRIFVAFDFATNAYMYPNNPEYKVSWKIMNCWGETLEIMSRFKIFSSW